MSDLRDAIRGEVEKDVGGSAWVEELSERIEAVVRAWLAEPSQAEIEAAAAAMCVRKDPECINCQMLAKYALVASRRVLGYPQTEEPRE
jgi:hypothetical protein